MRIYYILDLNYMAVRVKNAAERAIFFFGTLCALRKCLGKGRKDAERDYGRLATPTRTAQLDTVSRKWGTGPGE